MVSQSADYWASTESNRGNAWYVGSNVGYTGGISKTGSLTVRAAVAFTFNL